MGEHSQPARPKRGRRRTRSAAEEKDQFYIRATSPLADERARVLMHGDTFAVFDHFGDIRCTGLGEEGVFHEGTRYLSRLLLALGKYQPMFLSSTVKHDNDLLAVDLTNPDVFDGQTLIVPRGTLHVLRSKLLWQQRCYECVQIKNYGLRPVATALAFFFEADFADIFEVRGVQRPRRGQLLPPKCSASGVTLSYRGLDDVVRCTHLEFYPQPAVLNGLEADYNLVLEPQQETTVYLTMTCECTETVKPVLSFEQAVTAQAREIEASKKRACRIRTSSEEFDDLLARVVADLHMLTVQTFAGPYPYAGVPWFSTPFGRDGIITALECLWVNPDIARGVLAFLAATQAKEVNPAQDAEPGKILHETRKGEMAALGEIPFGRYYGSVDATPLFLMLAGAYYERTDDRDFIESIWPNLELALQWLDTYGDPDGDGFVEYHRRSANGLTQQGWKDSGDSVFHADGTLADGPIALCEVQGYAYAARLAMAELADGLRRKLHAGELLAKADALQRNFEQFFWCEELSTYALALDGNKQPCRVRASNAGQCLFTGIVSAERARRTADTLLSPAGFSGWGIRTLAATEVRYNPMSYHNGSVWPHDNALIAAGFARYGLTDGAIEVLARIFDASQYLDLRRLPELFCGFPRRSGAGPTLYPVACSPQAWAAGAIFMLLQACLGLHIDAHHQQISFGYPVLPEFLEEVQILDLRVGAATVDLLLRRNRGDVGINVLRREGKVDILTMK